MDDWDDWPGVPSPAGPADAPLSDEWSAAPRQTTQIDEMQASTLARIESHLKSEFDVIDTQEELIDDNYPTLSEMQIGHDINMRIKRSFDLLVASRTAAYSRLQELRMMVAEAEINFERRADIMRHMMQIGEIRKANSGSDEAILRSIVMAKQARQNMALVPERVRFEEEYKRLSDIVNGARAEIERRYAAIEDYIEALKDANEIEAAKEFMSKRVSRFDSRGYYETGLMTGLLPVDYAVRR